MVYIYKEQNQGEKLSDIFDRFNTLGIAPTNQLVSSGQSFMVARDDMAVTPARGNQTKLRTDEPLFYPIIQVCGNQRLHEV